MTHPTKKLSRLGKIKTWISRHKVASVIILIILIVAAYYIYTKAFAASAAPQYVLSPARIGTITQIVTGSGQVNAENQLDVTSEVSGKIQSINVHIGQHVNKGDLLVTLDARDALINLESARIAYAKLTKPAKAGDLTNAYNTLSKSYNDGFNAVSTTYLDLPSIMNGVDDLLYSRDGYLSDQNSSYLISSARTYRDTASLSYDKALKQYEKTLAEYKNVSRTSATSSIDLLVENTSITAKLITAMLQNIQNTITYIAHTQPEYAPTLAASASANVTTWSNQMINNLSALVVSQNTITSNKNSLNTLLTGAEDLDIQSQRLSLKQAEESYAKYFIRAPFDGVVGRIPVSMYGQAGSGTVMATIIGDRKIANISLNEVDTAKVKAGQHIDITFDAIHGFNATGTVGSIDLVGTMSQGVVLYTVKIILNSTDARIKPGMSINISIITNEKSGVLIVPSSAVKTQGSKKYVEVLPAPTPSRTSSSSPPRMITTTSTGTPRQVSVIIGENDDINTEIVNGLEAGEYVVTRTIAAGTATAPTPNILSSIGGNRGVTGGTRGAPRTGN